MESFSWTDRLRATVNTCLPCFNNPGSTSDSDAENEGLSSRQRSQRHYEELEGLLGDVADTDGDVETLSLHSNIGGAQQRRKKKKRAHKSIQLFGFNLFGRPPIQLSDSEEDEPDDGSRRKRRPGRLAIGQIASAHSSSSASAFDSDASPLDTVAISQLSPEDAAAHAARAAAEREAEEERRRVEREEKEERRRRRQERRKLKRMAAALANGTTMSLDGEEFEGFQGSGSFRSPFSPSSLSFSQVSPPVPRAPGDDFGPYVSGSNPHAVDEDPADGDEADFGGEAYVRKARSRGSDSSRSQSQSQTSASRSNADSSHYTHHHHQQFFQGSPLPSPVFAPGTAVRTQEFGSPSVGSTSGPGALIDASRQKKSKKSRSSNSATTSSKKSSGSPASQSASLSSLDSPVDANFSRKFAPSEPFIVEQDGEVPKEHSLDAVSPKDARESKFPSVGFGGVRRTNSVGSGAFLATRSED